MPSLRDIRRKIKSVKSTEQITKAMKMVAAARVRRSQTAILSARPFAAKLDKLTRELALLEVRADLAAGREVQIHPFFDRRTEGLETLVLVTGDKGLCGAFNSNAIRAAIDWLGERKGQKILVVSVGRKGREFLHRLKGHDLEVVGELAGIFPKVNFAHADLLGQFVLDAYLKRGARSVSILYNEFKSLAQQRLVTAQVLPIPTPENAGAALP
jgi:F-type H+-transporting ATPase subunit gamma